MSIVGDIHFCEQCHNLTFLHIREEDRKLIHYCKSCENSSEYVGDGCIFSQNFRGLDGSKIINSNKYINHDLTLPSIKDNINIKCPNSDCETNTAGTTKEIKYLKHDYDNMKFTYICITCGQKWKN